TPRQSLPLGQGQADAILTRCCSGQSRPPLAPSAGNRLHHRHRHLAGPHSGAREARVGRELANRPTPRPPPPHPTPPTPHPPTAPPSPPTPPTQPPPAPAR